MTIYRTAGDVMAQAPPQNQACCCPACIGLQCLDRPRFFAGQLLSEAELNGELEYLLAKNRLHNRYLHGWGVVCGLSVVCNECEGWVTVKPGYAIDACGNDIVVCRDQPFDLIGAIQQCCQPPRRRSDCDPLMPDPDPQCQDAEQRWCITIRYHETETRLVTPLRQPKCPRCGCTGGCGCGCQSGNGAYAGNGQKNGAGQPATACGPAPTPAQTPTGCEPTRIHEGYRLGIVPAPQPPAGTDSQPPPPPGTMAYEIDQCMQALSALLMSAPDVVGQNMSPAQAFAACCQYQAAVRAFFTQYPTTWCQVLRFLGTITCPPPPQDAGGGDYLQAVAAAISDLKRALFEEMLDCICLNMLPKCPADPCDDRLVLACVTVQNGRIIRICNFEGRRFLLGFPALEYWLGSWPIFADIRKAIELLCCGGYERARGVLAGVGRPQEGLAAAGAPGNPGAVYESVGAMFGQILGADALRAGLQQAAGALVDTRPYVSMNVGAVRRDFEARKLVYTEQAADAWPPEAVASAARYAPTAASPETPLVVYTKGEIVVGIEQASETQRLRAEVNDLRSAVATLQNQRGTPGRGRSG